MKVNDQKKRKSLHIKQRGSALLTAMIFSFVIGAIAVTFLKLATSEYRSSVRSTLYSASLNLAESGVEMGVAALGKGATSGSTWSQKVPGYLVDETFTGDVRFVIFDADKPGPTIYSEGIVRGHPSGDVVKQVRVTLSSGFVPYAKGFSARNGITFSGNGVLLDSYHSKYGPYGANLDASAPYDYGHNGTNKNDDVFVASDTVTSVDGTTVISQGNADVYGYVTVSPNSNVSIGPNGVVTSYENGSHDETRVLGDFYANFPSEPQPSGTYNSSYSSITGAATITGSANPDSPTYYDVSEISLSGKGAELAIDGHVVLVMSGDIKVSGKGGITINPGASLAIYTASDVDIAGQGVVNTSGVPKDFSLYGTAVNGVDGDGNLTAGQSIKISGNGQLSSTVYAPAADLSLNGGGNSGQVFGGVVAFTATVTGGSSFHFDEALRDIIVGGGIYTIESWLEMTGTSPESTPIDLSQY